MGRVKLNQKIVDSCKRPKSGKAPVVIRDSELIGLVVYVGAEKTTYRMEKAIKKVRYNEHLADASEVKFSEAKELFLEKKRAIIRGEQALNNASLVSDSVHKILVPHHEKFNKSSKSAISIINVYLLPFFGHLTISQVTFSLVQTSVYELIEQGLAAETIRKRVQSGHLFFELLIQHGLVTYNPFKGIKRPIVNNIRDYTLDAEARLPYIQILESINSVFADALLLMLFLALRVTETIQIKVSDISADCTRLTLQDTKANKRQYVEINSLAQKVINRRLALTNNEYLFPSPKYIDRHIAAPRSCFEKVKKIMRDKGFDISNMWMYDSRRTALTAAGEISNGNTFLLAGMARHSSPQILNRYVHCKNKAVADLSEATAQALLTPIQMNNLKET